MFCDAAHACSHRILLLGATAQDYKGAWATLFKGVCACFLATRPNLEDRADALRKLLMPCAVCCALAAEFTIEFDQLSEWISDVKKIFTTELFEGGKKK